MKLFLALNVFITLGAGCAHAPAARLERLQESADSFWHRLRWKDYNGAAMHLVPERQGPFVKARALANDETLLSISDYQHEEAFASADAQTARVVSRMSWVRFTDLRAHTASVTTHWVFERGQWWVTSLEGGPFPDLEGKDKK